MHIFGDLTRTGRHPRCRECTERWAAGLNTLQRSQPSFRILCSLGQCPGATGRASPQSVEKAFLASASMAAKAKEGHRHIHHVASHCWMCTWNAGIQGRRSRPCQAQGYRYCRSAPVRHLGNGHVRYRVCVGTDTRSNMVHTPEI